MKIFIFVIITILMMMSSSSGRPAVFDVIPDNYPSAPVELQSVQRESVMNKDLRSQARRFLRNQFRNKKILNPASSS